MGAREYAREHMRECARVWRETDCVKRECARGSARVHVDRGVHSSAVCTLMRGYHNCYEQRRRALNVVYGGETATHSDSMTADNALDRIEATAIECMVMLRSLKSWMNPWLFINAPLPR